MKKRNWVRGLCVACLSVGMLTCAASADVLFQEDFNGLAQSALANGTAATVGTMGVDNRGGAVNVAADPSGGAAGARGNVLYIIDYNRLGSYPNELRAQFATPSSSAVRMSYDIYNAGPVAGVENPEIGIFVEGSGRASYQLWYGTGPFSIINYGPGFDSAAVITGLANQSWMRVVMDMAAGTTEAGQTASLSVYSINADGTTGALLGSSPEMAYFQAVETYSQIRFGQSGGAGRSNFYLDNISVETIPEPATMCLLGLGGLAGLLRRKRK